MIDLNSSGEQQQRMTATATATAEQAHFLDSLVERVAWMCDCFPKGTLGNDKPQTGSHPTSASQVAIATSSDNLEIRSKN
jgi:hypothetical protein